MSGDQFNKKKAGKGRKRCTLFVDDRRTKILCFRGKRISWTSIRSDLSDAGVSVSSKTFRSRLADLLQFSYCRLYLEVVCLLRKPKVAGLILAGVDRFSGIENRRHEYHMIMWHLKDPLSINLTLVLSAIFSNRRELELKIN
ncbi:hypothetical protein TNCV_4963461 [Trichonephila clavipes]|nr:hypothetical protein TNCV_4963461 [Trichonephila clavipes]